jgi:hypothetical protein
MLNASYGIAGIDRAWSRPVQHGQGVTGLFDALNNALAPAADLGDPNSVRERAEYALNQGNQAEAARLSKMADETEARQAQAREQNIRKAYTAAQAQGKEKQLEGALIEAGYSDLIGKIKEEQMDRAVAMATGRSELDEAELQKYARAYTSASEAGRKAIAQHLRNTNRGGIADKLEESQVAEELARSQQALQAAEAESQMIQQQVNSIEVPDTRQGIMAQRSSLPPEARAAYDKRVEEVLNHRKYVDDFYKENSRPTKVPEVILDKAGWTQEQFDSYVKQFGLDGANSMLREASKTRPKPENDKQNITAAMAERAAGFVASAMSVERFGPFDTKYETDDPEVQAVIFEAENIYNSDPSVKTFQEAVIKVMGGPVQSQAQTEGKSIADQVRDLFK